MPVWLAAAAVLVGNLPFGYWRANVPKLSVQWALAIHIPVLLAILLRLLGGIPLEPVSFAVMASAFFLGQAGGQIVRRQLSALLPIQLTSCVFVDLARLLFD